MKQLLAENESAYTQILAQVTARLSPLQTILSAYTALGIATVPTTADLADLWAAPRTFLVRMITGGAAVQLSGGFAVNQERVYDILEKPEGSDEFVKLATKIKTSNDQSPHFGDHLPLDSAELIGGQVVLKQAVKDSLREQSRTYATTQAQLDEWNLLQTIVGALNTIRASGRHSTTFNSVQYLEKALVSQGRADGANPVKADAQFIVR